MFVHNFHILGSLIINNIIERRNPKYLIGRLTTLQKIPIIETVRKSYYFQIPARHVRPMTRVDYYSVFI